MQQQLDNQTDFEHFFSGAPRINPDASKITGVVCGIRVVQRRSHCYRGHC
ncbi:DUF2200 family protein [Lentimicrobium sp.]|nr:DUF2200 family protein [Lentimicrobium sp.]HPJ63755.1 DUF2200 family protein [Lentimicrobium sp.]